MEVRDDLRYTDDHEWLRVEGDVGVVGVTAYAADQLGDIVFVELPAPGASLAARQAFGVVESVKAVSDLLAPVAGEVLEVNTALAERPRHEADVHPGQIVHARATLPPVAGRALRTSRRSGPHASSRREPIASVHRSSEYRDAVTIARKLARRSYHVLRELGPAALEPIPTA